MWLFHLRKPEGQPAPTGTQSVIPKPGFSASQRGFAPPRATATAAVSRSEPDFSPRVPPSSRLHRAPIPSRAENPTANRRLRRARADHQRKLAEATTLADQVATRNFPDTEWVPSIIRVGLSHLPLDPGPAEEGSKQEAPRDEAPRTHIPAGDLLQQLRIYKDAQPREDRERVYEGEWSAQFDDAPKGSSGGDPLSQIAPKHQASDRTLLPLSAPDRLPRATSDQNWTEYRSGRAQHAGQLLWDSFRKGRSLPFDNQPFDEELFASCIAENDFAKLTNKTRSFILAAQEKSDPDWRYTSVRIFMKSQQKVNASTINGPWKKGQTLAQFNDQWLLEFGPVVRYISKKEAALCPPELFILAGKTSMQANAWAKEFIPGPGCTVNDYSAFDQSQTAESVVFEERHMRYWGIPQGLIDRYVHQKMHLSHQLWSSQIMRFTGEPGTYKFNTDFSEALAGLQYKFPPRHPRAHSGDDTLFPGHLEQSENWPAISTLFKCVSKTQYLAGYGDFCGYIYSNYGIIRDPLVLAVKLGIAWEAGKFDNVAESFAQELAIGNIMGDSVYEVLNSEQLEWRGAVGTFLFEHGGESVRSLLASRVMDDSNAPLYDLLVREGAQAVADLKKRRRLQAYQLLIEGRKSNPAN